jgi:CheY-like chemotaxis protein
VRILVVDDRFQSRWSIADGLSVFLAPVAVDSAASAREALAAIAKRKPDLVLAAHPMPDMCGIGLARQLKSQRNPPLVVVMTEQSNPRFESACNAAGADFWLEKRHLQARLLAFLQQRFSLRALRPSPFKGNDHIV